MESYTSLGVWFQRRRKVLALTQVALGDLVGISAAMIRRLEADERRPSKAVATRLAQALRIPVEEQATFLKVARGERTVDHLPLASTPPPPVDHLAGRTPQRRHNLPAQATPLIGRAGEVAAVTSRLREQDVRLLTLTGPGGVGKTRLALAVAHALQHDFTDGVWFVDLAPTHEPARVMVEIAQVVGVKERGGLPLRESLQANLRDQHLLLVLDNFEQVIAAAPHIAALLQAAEHLTVLVTSRVTLHLSGEHEVAVPPLALPDPHHLPPLDRLTQYAAIDLFLQRCLAARADFQVTAATAPAVAEICVRLDGLPLALELAAARIKLFSPNALLQRLDHRLTLLIGGARDKDARQQTLRATIDWSYNLLDAAEQRLFARLGVFVGGWTLEAAEVVGSALGDLAVAVLDGLQALMDKSLVQVGSLLGVEEVEDEPRFTMLETIHAYALEHLDASDEAGAIRQANAAYFLSWAETAARHLGGPLQGSYVKRLAADYENLRAVHEWLLAQHEIDMAGRLGVALSGFFFVDRPVQGLRWLEEVLAAMEEQGGRQRAQVLLRAADLAWRTGDRGRARAYAQAGVQICTEEDDTWGRAFGLHVLGIVAREEYELVPAAAWFTESLALFQELGDQHRIAWGHLNLGTLAFAQQDYTRGRALLEESLSRFRGLNDGFGLASAFEILGEAAHAQGDRAYALRCLDETVAYRSQGETGGGAWAVRWAAYGMWLHGQSAEAKVLLDQAVQQYRAAGDTTSVTTVLYALAWVVEDQGDHARARAAGEECLQRWRERGATRDIVQALVLLGHVANEQANYGRAHQHFAESLVLYCDEGLAGASVWSLVGLARAARRDGQSSDGERRAARLLGAVEPMGWPIMSSIRRRHYDRELAAARRGLDDETLATEWAEGRAMTLEQAIAYALEDVPAA